MKNGVLQEPYHKHDRSIIDTAEKSTEKKLMMIESSCIIDASFAYVCWNMLELRVVILRWFEMP